MLKKHPHISHGVLALALFGFVGSASAGRGGKGSWELAPYVGFGFPDSYALANLDTGPIVGGRFGYAATDLISVELSGHRLFTERSGGADVDMDAYRLNVLFNFLTGDRFQPFLTVGGGLERANIAAGVDEKDFAPNGGVGLRWYATNRFGVRVDGRYIPVKVGGIIDDWQHNMEATASIFVSLGGKKEEPKPTPTPTPTPEPDSDGDGVADSLDKCPGTPAGSAVDSTGCVPVGDADADGVKDDLDKCPATPAGIHVDANGCPVDSDGDGARDDVDKCPGTPPGTEVDTMGCPKVSKARGALKGVVFMTSSWELMEESKKLLNDVAVELKNFPNVKVEIQGHTDSTGDATMNLNLSDARARSVMEYLVSQGIPKEQLTSKGYGKTKPVATNKTKDGRQQNRRVEMVWLE